MPSFVFLGGAITLHRCCHMSPAVFTGSNHGTLGFCFQPTSTSCRCATCCTPRRTSPRTTSCSPSRTTVGHRLVVQTQAVENLWVIYFTGLVHKQAFIRQTEKQNFTNRANTCWILLVTSVTQTTKQAVVIIDKPEINHV